MKLQCLYFLIKRFAVDSQYELQYHINPFSVVFFFLFDFLIFLNLFISDLVFSTSVICSLSSLLVSLLYFCDPMSGSSCVSLSTRSRSSIGRQSFQSLLDSLSLSLASAAWKLIVLYPILQVGDLGDAFGPLRGFFGTIDT